MCNLNLEELKAVVQVLISATEPDIELPTSKLDDDNICLLPVENQFELASKFDLAGQYVPKRQVIANVCQWEYRSSECSYTGSSYFDEDDKSTGSLASDRCGKKVSSCKLRFGQHSELPFGSFPSAGKVR